MTQAHTTTAAKLPRLRKPKPVAPRSKSRPAPVQDQVMDFAQAIAKLPPPPRGYAVVDPALVPDTMLDRTVMLYDDTLKRWCLFDGFNPGMVSTAWNAVRGTFFAVKVAGVEPETFSSNNSRVDIEPPYWCELSDGTHDSDAVDSFTYNASAGLQEPTHDSALKWTKGRGWVRVQPQPGFILHVGDCHDGRILRARAINQEWLDWYKRHSAVALKIVPVTKQVSAYDSIKADADAMAMFLEQVLDNDYARHDPIWDDIRIRLSEYRNKTRNRL